MPLSNEPAVNCEEFFQSKIQNLCDYLNKYGDSSFELFDENSILFRLKNRQLNSEDINGDDKMTSVFATHHFDDSTNSHLINFHDHNSHHAHPKILDGVLERLKFVLTDEKEMCLALQLLTGEIDHEQLIDNIRFQEDFFRNFSTHPNEKRISDFMAEFTPNQERQFLNILDMVFEIAAGEFPNSAILASRRESCGELLEDLNHFAVASDFDAELNEELSLTPNPHVQILFEDKNAREERAASPILQEVRLL